MAYCAVHGKTFPDAAPCCPWCSGDWDDEEDECTCDSTGIEGCPAHYPIDDDIDEEDCMYFEEMQNGER